MQKKFFTVATLGAISHFSAGLSIGTNQEKTAAAQEGTFTQIDANSRDRLF